MTAAAISDYEAVLAAEGLAPVSGPEVLAFQPLASVAVETWRSWAIARWNNYKFRSSRSRRMWKLYADGVSVTAIAQEMNVGRRRVTRLISRVKEKSPPAPLANPKRKSCRDVGAFAGVPHALLARFARAAVASADLGHLFHLLRRDPDLLALMDKGDTMAKNEAAPVPVTEKTGARKYARILMADGAEVKIERPRGNTKRSYGLLVDVVARPTSAGLDVEFETYAKGDSRAETITIITIPWGRIAQADRTVGGED